MKPRGRTEGSRAPLLNGVALAIGLVVTELTLRHSWREARERDALRFHTVVKAIPEYSRA